jgi:hypothetical protein
VTKRHKTQEILAKLRHVEKLAASGRRISDCMQEIGVTEVTYYRWRNRYDGLENDLAEHLAELEAGIARLRRAVSDLTLDKLILVEATKETLSPELRAVHVLHARTEFGISERRPCQALVQHRSTQRKIGARLSQEALPGGQPRHSATVRPLPTNLSDRRLSSRDSAIRGGQDMARGESGDIDPGVVESTGAMKSVGQ